MPAASGSYTWNNAAGAPAANGAAPAAAPAQPAQPTTFAQPPAMPSNGEDDLPF